MGKLMPLVGVIVLALLGGPSSAVVAQEDAAEIDKPPAFIKQGLTGVPLQIEATVTGEHNEGARPWTTGGYGGGVRTVDAAYNRPEPKIKLNPSHIPDKPAKEPFNFRIPCWSTADPPSVVAQRLWPR